MTDKKTLLLVDGSSYLYRAFHAMPDLRAVPGDPKSPATGAIRGMINMMTALRREVRADYAACIFDAPGKTFRDDLYPEYKANRSPMPDDLRSQIDPIHEVVKLMGWPVLCVPDIEADDVIGTLAKTAAQQGVEVIVSSGDKDLSQLVDEHITIIDTMNGKKRDVAGVTSEFGVPPNLMIDYQTLVGDAVDNVPGVEKVGPKTAAKWLLEYGSLDALIERAAEVKGQAGENLRKAIDKLPLSRQLVTIRTDCDLAAHVAGLPSLEGLPVGAPQTAELKPFYERFGFKSLVKSIEALEVPPELIEENIKKQMARGAAASADQGGLFDESAELGALEAAAPASNLRYETLTTWEQFDAWLARLEAAGLAAIDTETTSLDEMVARIVGVSFSIEPGAAAYVPLAHNYPDAPAQLPIDEVLARLKPWLENPAKKNSASTSSTTAMCSPTTASKCRAMRTTPCCRATCSRRTVRTGSRAWPNATWAAAASRTKTCAARARTRSRSARSTSPRPPNIRARTATRRSMSTWRCGRRSSATRSCASSTSSRWIRARRSTASSATAC